MQRDRLLLVEIIETWADGEVVRPVSHSDDGVSCEVRDQPVTNLVRPTAPSGGSPPRATGLDGTRIHDLRHTAVSLWIAAGASPKQIATWAGHTSVSVVLDRYGHLYEGNDGDVLARLDSFASITPGDGSFRWIPRVCRGARDDLTPDTEVPQAADLGKRGGREGTRTPGLCRVKAAL